MSKQTVNIGAVADDGTGDSIRAGGDKINDNFDELYALLGGDTLTAAGARTALDAEQIGVAAAAVAAHEAASDPHPVYLTQAEADALYATSSHTHTSAAITDFVEAVQDVMGAILVDTNTLDWTYNDAGNALGAEVKTQMSLTSDASGVRLSGDAATPGNSKLYGTNGSGVKGWYDQPSGGVSDGDKGDITVSASGATWTIDNDAVTFAKMQNIATDRLLGRDTAASGDVEELAAGYGLSFLGGPSIGVALSQTSAFVTAETTISAATYADITGASVSLAAGTWLVIGQVNIRQPNAIVQAFVAITDGANAVISETAASRPASGTASLNSPFSLAVHAIVSPGATTTYKLRGARGLTTHTGSWVAMDGNGVNTTNHASNNSDKGTGIFAIRIA